MNNEANTPFIHNQYAPQVDNQGNQYPQYNTENNQNSPYPLQQQPVYPPQQQPQQIFVVQKDSQKSPYQYQYNLPEKPVHMNCPYCKEEGQSELVYRFNWCCLCLLIFSILITVSILIFAEALRQFMYEQFNSVIPTPNLFSFLPSLLFWSLMVYLSRAFKHVCKNCKRELGRGKPDCSCCVASLD